MPLWAWAAFFTFITAMLALDLGVFQRKSHVVGMKEALGWCVVWVLLALAFSALLWQWRGPEPAQQFLAGYLIELCLSVDNVFVFILVSPTARSPPASHTACFFGASSAPC